MLEENGYTIELSNHLEFRQGLRSGIRKYLVSFQPYRTPVRLPAMVEMYGRKIGFEQTQSSMITDRIVVQPVENITVHIPENEKRSIEVSTTIPPAIITTVEPEPTLHNQIEEQIVNMDEQSMDVEPAQKPTPKALSKLDTNTANSLQKFKDSLKSTTEESSDTSRSFAEVVRSPITSPIKKQLIQPSDALKTLIPNKEERDQHLMRMQGRATGTLNIFGNNSGPSDHKTKGGGKSSDPRTKLNPYPISSPFKIQDSS